MIEFEIIDAGCIEGTSIHFLKGYVRKGSIVDTFLAKIVVGENIFEIKVIGKSLLPLQDNPDLTGYVLKIEPLDNVDYASLIGSSMLSE